MPQSPPHKSHGHSRSDVISFSPPFTRPLHVNPFVKPNEALFTIYLFFFFFFLLSLLVQTNMDALVWDSNSKLCDSLEVSSFRRQLDAAIAGRCHGYSTLLTTADGRKKKSRLSKSLQKLLRLVFGFKPREATWLERYGYGLNEREVHESAYPVRWSGGGLASIPEVSEKGTESPEIDYSAVRRAVSEQFTSSTSTSCRSSQDSCSMMPN